MATIKHVAQRANVSIATVSYVLNGTGAVRPDTRRAVLDAAAALDYRPSYRGRALQARRSMTLGLAVAASTIEHDRSSGTLLAGVTAVAAAHEYHVLLVADQHRHDSSLIPLFRTGRIDGAIVVDTLVDDARIGAAQLHRLPIVASGSDVPDSFVGIDMNAGLLEVVAHLVGLGHERVALLNQPLDSVAGTAIDQAFRDALAEAGLPFLPEYVVECGTDDNSAYEMVADLLDNPQPPTAIIAATIALAYGAIHALHDRGVPIGLQVALVSLEDAPAAAHTSPPLTALRQPTAHLGAALATALIERIGGGAQHRELLTPQLIVRQSCGEPRAGWNTYP